MRRDQAYRRRSRSESRDAVAVNRLGSGGKDNVDALTLAINGHAKYVFDKLAVYNDDTVPGGERQYELNASELGTLFKTTLFNPDSTYRNQLQDTITKYAGDLERAVNADGTNQNAADHLTMLAAGLTDGVRQGYNDDAKARQAKNELLGMVVDIALAGIPAGKWVNKAVEDRLKTAGRRDGLRRRALLDDVMHGRHHRGIGIVVARVAGEAPELVAARQCRQ